MTRGGEQWERDRRASVGWLARVLWHVGADVEIEKNADRE